MDGGVHAAGSALYFGSISFNFSEQSVGRMGADGALAGVDPFSNALLESSPNYQSIVNPQSTAIVLSLSGVADVRDTDTGEPIADLAAISGSQGFFSPDGRYLLLSGSGMSLRVFDTSDWTEVRTIPHSGNYLQGAPWSTDDTFAVADNGAIAVYGATNPADDQIVTVDDRTCTSFVGWGSLGRWAALCSEMGAVTTNLTTSNTDGSAPRAIVNAGAGFALVVYSPSRSRLLATENGTFRLAWFDDVDGATPNYLTDAAGHIDVALVWR